MDGTEREVLALLQERGARSPTEVAQTLDVSVQTASRNLRKLVDRGFAVENRMDPDRRDGRRGYKAYEPVEVVELFAGYDGKIVERSLGLSPDKKSVLSVWTVPQAEYHPVLLSYLFTPLDLEPWSSGDVRAIAVFGPVARGEATDDSDIDVLVVCDDAVETDDLPMSSLRLRGHVFSHRFVTVSDLAQGIETGTPALQGLLEEAVVVYDPSGVLRDSRRHIDATSTG